VEKTGEEFMEQGRTANFGYRLVPEEEKMKWVERHFNCVASRYDLGNTLLSFGIHYLWKRTAVKMMGLKPGDKVIDVCGGTADLALMAAGYIGKTGRIVVYDINRSMLEVGKPKVLESPFADQILYVQGDAECISFPDNSFDAAMVGFGIRNLTHMEKGFEEMHRVLKPGGKLMCLEFSQPTARWFRWLYDTYSFYIMPAVGEMLVGSRLAYTYLPESIRLFPSPEQLSAKLEGIGFERVAYRRLTNGISVIHLGVRR
jgi:demethylmenaquinone methyltransferase/2-methoxy-6-polyprenyl-1,4-benzoquinol methylase